MTGTEILGVLDDDEAEIVGRRLHGAPFLKDCFADFFGTAVLGIGNGPLEFSPAERAKRNRKARPYKAAARLRGPSD